MLLDTIFLDGVYQHSLERLCIREGWITSRYDEPLQKIDFQLLEENRILHKSKILLLMTLFDHVDSSFSLYSFEKLKKTGFIKSNANITDDTYKPEFDEFFGGETEDNKLMMLAHQNTNLLFRESKFRVINHVIGSSMKGSYIHRSKTRTSKIDLSFEYERVINCFFQTNETDEILDKDPHLSSYLTEMEILWSSVRKGIYHSVKNKYSTATVLTSTNKPPKSIIQVIDDLYYLVRTNFLDEIRILPNPRCIDESIELRDKAEMQRFREVLNEWLNALMVSDMVAEKKLRKDIASANRSLKFIKRWREYERSPFNFWFNAVGGHIPVLSNAISVVNTVGALTSNYYSKKSSWVALRT